jgi:hypothetical protein
MDLVQLCRGNGTRIITVVISVSKKETNIAGALLLGLSSIPI